MALSAGKLDRKIMIERKSVENDDFNNPVETWFPIANVWASKADVRDSERVAAKEVGAEIGTRFQIRYSANVADVNPKDRIKLGGLTYGIVAVKEIGRREGLEITAAARADAA